MLEWTALLTSERAASRDCVADSSAKGTVRVDSNVHGALKCRCSIETQREMERTPAIREFWAAYRGAAGLTHDRYTVVRPGDSPELAVELIELMLAGTKRATACLAREFALTGEPLPQPGDYVVVVDDAHDPRCVWQTTEVTIKPLIEVDDAFAWDEGEGDRSRASWLDNHRRCFARQASREGFAMHDQIETVFERFRIVWPSDIADRT